MLYKKNTEKKLTADLFKNPTAEYRGAPFWSWNCRLEKEELLRQIDIFKEMGIGGFHIHSRSGLATPYMGNEFMDLVDACHKKALENNMLMFLYDEDRWPSGAAGGFATKDYAYRMRYLVFCPCGKRPEPNYDAAARYVGSGKITPLGLYKVELDNGLLTGYSRLAVNPKSGETGLWEAYLEISGNSPWFNNQAYLNTLDKEAVNRFLEETHEKYRGRLGNFFGKSIPSIFTDEPQFSHKENFGKSDEQRAITIPFTDDFDDTYMSTYGESFLEHLPELFWEWSDGRPSKTRYQYHDHACERFTCAFVDTVGAWCEKNGIMMTGHMMYEHDLTYQTRAMGEAIRAYRSFQFPGIDMLCDKREYATAKQAQSAVRQYGREGLLSEMYGVTNWDFDFRGHKLQGDWQAALGVTLRVHHLTWVSMAGEGKRDYPACIGYQSPWYSEYSYVEDHFARLNTALTRGKPVVRVAVIHPIEGFWVIFGPSDKTSEKRAEMEKDFANVIEWLLYGHIDFDFVSESLLPQQQIAGQIDGQGKFIVGAMSYDAVLIPNCLSLRSSTISALEKFCNAGGKVIFAGKPAAVTDGSLSQAAVDIAERCVHIPFAKTPILESLEDFRDIDLRLADGCRAEHLLYQLRRDGDALWLFVANGPRPENHDIPRAEDITLSINGIYTLTLYNTQDGSLSPLQAYYSKNTTVLQYRRNIHDSLLLKLSPHQAENQEFRNDRIGREKIQFQEGANWVDIEDPYAFELEEPNVMVLDMAMYAFDNGSWQPKEELLRIDNLFRSHLGFPMRTAAWAQPWTRKSQSSKVHFLHLRFDVLSEIQDDGVYLAMEGLDELECGIEIIWNDIRLGISAEGYYVDRAIKKIKLPGLTRGNNKLVLKIPFNEASQIENLYLLGHFGVSVAGANTSIIPYPKSLPFGNIASLGLPFYGGNVKYKCHIRTNGENTVLEATYFRCPLLKVNLDGMDLGRIAYAPYTVQLGHLAAGSHELEITAYGNRINTFGTLHNCDETMVWPGPHAWRSTGVTWSYQYNLKPAGLLKSPRIGTIQQH